MVWCVVCEGGVCVVGVVYVWWVWWVWCMCGVCGVQCGVWGWEWGGGGIEQGWKLIISSTLHN